MARDISTFPQSLRSAAAADQLARDLYVADCHFYGEAVREWERVAPHLKSAYLEIAFRTLQAMNEGRESPRDSRPLYDLATALARGFSGNADLSRVTYMTGLRRADSNVIGMITPDGGAAA